MYHVFTSTVEGRAYVLSFDDKGEAIAFAQANAQSSSPHYAVWIVAEKRGAEYVRIASYRGR